MINDKNNLEARLGLTQVPFADGSWEKSSLESVAEDGARLGNALEKGMYQDLGPRLGMGPDANNTHSQEKVDLNDPVVAKKMEEVDAWNKRLEDQEKTINGFKNILAVLVHADHKGQMIMNAAQAVSDVSNIIKQMEEDYARR